MKEWKEKDIVCPCCFCGETPIIRWEYYDFEILCKKCRSSLSRTCGSEKESEDWEQDSLPYMLAQINMWNKANKKTDQ